MTNGERLKLAIDHALATSDPDAWRVAEDAAAEAAQPDAIHAVQEVVRELEKANTALASARAFTQGLLRGQELVRLGG